MSSTFDHVPQVHGQVLTQNVYKYMSLPPSLLSKSERMSTTLEVFETMSVLHIDV